MAIINLLNNSPLLAISVHQIVAVTTTATLTETIHKLVGALEEETPTMFHRWEAPTEVVMTDLLEETLIPPKITNPPQLD